MQEGFVLKTIKKVAAIGTGIAMLGATLTGALALDLGEYPSPFVVGGVYDDTNAIVTGANALAADTLGAVDITANLQFESKATAAGTATSVTVTGGKTEQVALGKDLTASTYFDSALQDDDIDVLIDSTITFQGTEYDVEDELIITSGVTGPYVATSITSSEPDYKSDVFLEIPNTKTIKYCFKFTEATNLSDSSVTQPLEMSFLGRDIKVYSVGDSNTLSAFVGEEHYLLAGASVTVEGKTVTLNNVGTSSAVVDIDGVSATISTGASTTLSGLEIYIKDVVSRTELGESAATVVIGSDAVETYDDNDAFIGEDKDDPDWRWSLTALTGTSPTLCVDNDFSYNDLDDNPPGVGECLDLPFGYLSICLDSLTVADTDYKDYIFEYKSSVDVEDAGHTGGAAEKGIYIHTALDEGFELLAAGVETQAVQTNASANKKCREFWIINNGTASSFDIYYYNTDIKNEYWFGEFDAAISSAAIARINYENTKSTNIELRPSGEGAGADTNLTLRLDILGDAATDLDNATDDIEMNWGLATNEIDSLGDTGGGATAEGDELKIFGGNDSGTVAWKTIGTYDEDHRTKYGIIIKNPDSHGSNDEVKLSIPNDQVFANVVIKGTTTVVAAGEESVVPTAITVKTMLHNEVTTAASYNLILVGGPCANPLVETVFGLTCDGWTYSAGEAIIKLAANDGKVAMLVAGTSADDTRMAAKVIGSYADWTLTGTEVLVKGTNKVAASVEAV